MPGRRISVRDAGWLPNNLLRVIGPLAGVTPSTVGRSLQALHRRDPDHPAFCRLDRPGRRWIPLGAAEFSSMIASHVGELSERHGTRPDPGDTESGPAAALRRALIAEDLGEWPLRILLHNGYVGIRLSHAVGDGHLLTALIPELLGTPGPAQSRRTRAPLAQAALRYFGRDPRRLSRMLTLPRPMLPDPAPHARYRAWRPDPYSHHARSGDDLLPGLREWRDHHLPGVSIAALLFAATRTAFEQCGLTPGHRGLMILVDARRYLPPSAVVRGNFSAAQYVVPADPRDPAAVQQALAAAIAAGRPLTTLAVLDLHALRRPGHATGTRDRVPTDPAPRLTLTHLGRLDHYAALPWACPPEQRVLISAPTTDGPEGVTVTYAELAGALHLNVTYQRSTFDPAAMRRCADLICADPVALVTAAGRHPSHSGTAAGPVVSPDVRRP